MSKKKDKKEFDRKKPHCNIGTIGHVDHGKTTLTSAITKVLAGIGETKYRDYYQIDSNIEERDRKITISAAHIEYETENRHYTHIDCPGHQDYIKNMITGANQMDGVILVVSATTGPQVQTREHVILAKEIGIPYMIVFLNKIDSLKDTSLLELIELEVRDLIESYGFSEETPFIYGSALEALKDNKEYIGSVKKLMETADTYINLPDKEEDKPFLMPTESLVIAQGRGTVLTGLVERGVLKVGDELDLVTENKVFKLSCLGIEMYHRKLDTALKGDNVGILVKGVGRKDIKKIKNCVLSKPGSIQAYNGFKARVYILTEEEGGRSKPFGMKYRPQFFFRLSNVTGSMEFLDGMELVRPGDHVSMNVFLNRKSVINEGLRFIIREGRLTIGAGVITSVFNN